MNIHIWYQNTIKSLVSKRIYNLEQTLLYLLAHVLQKTASEISIILLQMSDEKSADTLNTKQVQQLQLYTSELSKGKPLSNILQSSFFCDYEFYVNENVLCPRQATQALVYAAYDRAMAFTYMIASTTNTTSSVSTYNTSYIVDKPIRIVDLGTGSGCIAISLSKMLAKAKIPAEVYAIDVSAKALDVCIHNAEKLSDGDFAIHTSLDYTSPIKASDQIAHSTNHLYLLKSNWFSIFKNTCTHSNTHIQFDIIISNPPYIAHNEYVHKSAKFDPQLALYADEQGFKNYKIILEQSKKYTHTHSKIIFEIPNKFVSKLPSCSTVAISKNVAMAII